MIERENEKINASRSELVGRKVDLEARIQSAKQADADIKGIQRACEIVKDNLNELTFETKRRALEALKIKVWVDKGRVNIEGTIPNAYGVIVPTPPRLI